MADEGELPLALQGKHRVFEAMLEHGLTAVVLDPQLPGVVVPRWLHKQDTLVLNYSWRFQISDFRFDAEAVEASLSFRGTPTYCRVPWDAVIAIRSEVVQHSFTWTDILPPELLSALAREEPSARALPGVVEVEGNNVRAHSAAGTVIVEVAQPRPVSVPAAVAPNEARLGGPRAAAESAGPPRRTARRPNLRVIGGGSGDADLEKVGPEASLGAEALALEAAAAPSDLSALAEGGEDAASPRVDDPDPEAPPPPRPRPALRLVR